MSRNALVLATIASQFVLAASPAFAQGERGWRWGDGWWGFGHMMYGGVGMLVFWGVIVLLIVLVARALGGFGSAREPSGPSRQTALEILQERYARGEIDQQEYEERRKTLGG